VLPGILLGLGLGGFVDGILVHQILQWHHMRSGDGIGGDRSMTTVGGLEANTVADGLSSTPARGCSWSSVSTCCGPAPGTPAGSAPGCN
jgi:uncharacterized membrane protein